MTSSVSRNFIEMFPETKSFSRIPKVIDVPDLVDIQKESFLWFKDSGLMELFNEIIKGVLYSKKTFQQR